MLAAIFAALVCAIIVVCAGLLAHIALNRRRVGAWGAQWRATGHSTASAVRRQASTPLGSMCRCEDS